MTKLVQSRFSDLLSFVVDNRGRTCPTAPEGTPLIATNCVTGRQRCPTLETNRFVDQETMDSWFRAHPEPGDILFVCKGAPGRVAVVPDPVGFCIAQDMVAVRADPVIMDSGYLYYLLCQSSTHAAIENMHVGTMIPHFKKGDFPRLILRHHADVSEQRAIAEVLGALDDKIAANEDLVRRCDELRRHKVAEALTHSGVAALPLSETADFVNGRNFTKDATGTGRPVIRIAELNGGFGASTVYNAVVAADVNVARPGDLLFAWSGSLTLRRWHLTEGVVNQHIFKVVAKPGWPLWLVAGLLERQLNEFKAIAADKATTMGHIQRRHLDVSVPVPSASWIASEQALMSTLWAAAVSAEREAQKLAALRDALLPELMSGRLTVKDAESQVEEVV